MSTAQTEPNIGTSVSQIVSHLAMLPEDEQLQTVIKLMQQETSIQWSPQMAFFDLCLKAVEHLRQVRRSNIVYGPVQGLETIRKDRSNSRLPALRMPMGLLEYIVSFHSAATLNQVNQLLSDTTYGSVYIYIFK